MPLDSNHSKLVKRRVAQLFFNNALEESCGRVIEETLRLQIVRLIAAGFSASLVIAVAACGHVNFKNEIKEC